MWLLVQWMDESKPNLSYAVVNSDTLPMRPQTCLETGQLIFVQDSEMQARRAQILKVSDDRQSVEQFKLTLQRQDHQVQNMLSLCMSNFRQTKSENMCVPLDLPLADETIDVTSSEEESELNYEIPPKLHINHQHEGDLPVQPRWRYSEPLSCRSQVSHLEARRRTILDTAPAPESSFADSPLSDHSSCGNRRIFDTKPPLNVPKNFVITESGTKAESKILANQNLPRVMQIFSVKSHANIDHGQSPFHSRKVLQRPLDKTVIEHQCKCTLRKQRFDSNRTTLEPTQPKKATADKAIQTDDHDKELQENVEQIETQLKELYKKCMKLMIQLNINVNTSDSHAKNEDCKCHCESKKKISSANQNSTLVPNRNVVSRGPAAEQNQNSTEVSFTENKYNQVVLEADNYKGQKDSDGETDNSDCSLTYDSKLLEENQRKFRLWVEKALTVKEQIQINNNSHLLISNSDNDSTADENRNQDARDSILQKKEIEVTLNNVDGNEPMQLDSGLKYNFAHNSTEHHQNEKAVEKEASNLESTMNEFPKNDDVRHKNADNVRNFNSNEIQPAHDYNIPSLEQLILANGLGYNKMERHYEDKFNRFNQFRQEVSIEHKANANLSGPQLFIPPVRPSTSQAKTVEVRRASAQTTTNCGLPSYSNVSERNPLVPIGAGNVVLPAELLNRINWNSASVATRQLLQAIFPREVLGTHSLSGKPPPAFPDIPPKKRLDPVIISDIMSEVMGRCGTSKQMIRQFITSKCADEARLHRIRWQARQNMRQSNSNNVDDQENNPPTTSIDSDSM